MLGEAPSGDPRHTSHAAATKVDRHRSRQIYNGFKELMQSFMKENVI
jgi:hypothetical protein